METNDITLITNLKDKRARLNELKAELEVFSSSERLQDEYRALGEKIALLEDEIKFNNAQLMNLCEPFLKRTLKKYEKDLNYSIGTLDDLYQMAAIRIMDAIDSFICEKENASLYGWVSTIATKLAIKTINKGKYNNLISLVQEDKDGNEYCVVDALEETVTFCPN